MIIFLLFNIYYFSNFKIYVEKQTNVSESEKPNDDSKYGGS